jgi:hypothetical protein
MNILRDSLVIARRNTIRIRRVPDVMVFVLIQPLMFVVLFAMSLADPLIFQAAVTESF